MRHVWLGLLATAVLALPLALLSQEFRGSISGVITDPTGAMVAGAQVTVTEFFLNAKGQPRPVTHLNQYGLTAGAPVILPKVFNGRNKSFWFFAWESMKDGQPNPNTTTVPTAAERLGDFSAVPGLTLYDPFSAVRSGSTVTRSKLTGNQIPNDRLNPIARSYLNFYPSPTVPNSLVNVINHPVFAAPNTTASNYQFGQITATANRFRTLQLGARVIF